MFVLPSGKSLDPHWARRSVSQSIGAVMQLGVGVGVGIGVVFLRFSIPIPIATPTLGNRPALSRTLSERAFVWLQY